MLFWNMHSAFFGIYLACVFITLSFTAGTLQLADVTANVCSADRNVCVLVRTDDMLKCENGLILIRSMQRSCHIDHLSYSAEAFGETITIPFDISNTAFVFIAFFSFSCHRYMALILPE